MTATTNRRNSRRSKGPIIYIDGKRRRGLRGLCDQQIAEFFERISELRRRK